MRFLSLRLLPITILAFAVLSSCAKKEAPVAKKDKAGPIAVTAAKVHMREIQRIVDSVGTLFPFDEAIISAEIDGRVDKVSFDLGDVVKEGQILVHIGDEEQRYLLLQNEAQMKSAMERLGLRNEKDRVADVAQTPDMRRAQADLFDAEQRYKRVRNLADQGIGSQQDLDQAKSRFDAAQAALDATSNQTRNLIQEVERFRAIVDLQRKKLRDTTVKAPFAGSVKERQVTAGQYVRANTPLLVLVKTDPVRLRMEVPERMAPWVKVGQVAQVSLEAFTDRKFEGKIWRISPTVDQAKRTFIVEALITNSNGQLKPGSYARTRIPTEKTDRALLVPTRAVNYILGSNKAYIIKDGTIEAREVKLGDRFEQEVEILEGVEDGESVATSQLPRLDNGVKVSIAPAPEGGAPKKTAKAE
ncbi:MAG: efflux RND transporter periplasmic adaptor subunit [Acidobacteria bacterium]|nr:efflux RND transporter periplasmic adaptor subunit [Acidobacteriota bacterium]